MDLLGKWIKWALAVLLGAAVLWGSGQAVAKPRSKAQPSAAPAAPVREVKITVTEKGYEPSPITLKQGEPVKLLITRVTEQTCATDIVIDEPKTRAQLPLNKEVAVQFTPTKTGELTYGCSMDKMVSGVFIIQ
jgi:plastocyanin domain-containing protein